MRPGPAPGADQSGVYDLAPGSEPKLVVLAIVALLVITGWHVLRAAQDEDES